MFGFNNNSSKDKTQIRKDYENSSVHNAMLNTFGASSPAKINQILRQYMPEVTNAILNTENYAVANNKNMNIIYENLLHKLEELEEQNAEAQHRNQELQAKYDALVERMAGYIERENGKGR